MQVFVTGTDTNVGKTLVCSWLCAHTKATYYKPIQSGCLTDSDSQTVSQLTNAEIYPEDYRLKAPLSPHLAAQQEQIEIKLETFRLPAKNPLIVEGAGGILVPINQNTLMVDLIKYFQLPTIIVCRTSLGTINHTLLTLQVLQQHRITVYGVIMSGEPNQDNLNTIEHYGKTKVLAVIPQLKEVNTQTLLSVSLPDFLKHLILS
jgi:dethiobiotin synthase